MSEIDLTREAGWGGIEKLKMENERLRKERDWLAEKVSELDFLYNSEVDCEEDRPKSAAEWREIASSMINEEHSI